MVACDIFNLSKLKPYFDKQFENVYEEAILSIKEGENEDFEDDDFEEDE